MEKKKFEYTKRTSFGSYRGAYRIEVKRNRETQTKTLSIYRVYENAPWWSAALDYLIEEPRVLPINKPLKGIIRKAILDYEMPIYEEYVLMSEDSYMEIDYEEEMKKRNSKKKEVETEYQSTHSPDLGRAAHPLDTGYMIIKDAVADTQFIHIKNTGENILVPPGTDPNSYAQLKQVQDKIKKASRFNEGLMGV